MFSYQARHSLICVKLDHKSLAMCQIDKVDFMNYGALRFMDLDQGEVGLGTYV